MYSPRTIFLLLALIVLTGCSTQLKTNIEHNVNKLPKSHLAEYGLTFITPTTITGMEQDKQYLALTFSHSLQELRPELKITNLSDTLSAINSANLTKNYTAMYDYYSETGIFNKDTLKKIGSLTGDRYICQLKLSHFKSFAQGRLGILGLAITDTEKATLRLFVQIWDSLNGIIVWEAAQELTYAFDTISEEPVTLEQMIRFATVDIAKVLP